MAYQQTAQQFPGSGALTDELTRWVHVENFEQVPGIAGDTDAIATGAKTITTAVANAIALADQTSKRWMVAGTNATSALCTAAVGGGIKLTTAGADNDQAYILPQTNGALNGLEAVKFKPSAKPFFGAAITTGASVALTAIWAGLLLTVPGPLDYTTDADKIYVGLDTDTSANWYVRYSIGGTDYAIDTGITVAAATNYAITISVDAAYKATVLIDDAAVHTTPALTSTAALIPSVGIQDTGAGSAKHMFCRKVILARDFGTD